MIKRIKREKYLSYVTTVEGHVTGEAGSLPDSHGRAAHYLKPKVLTAKKKLILSFLCASSG